MFDKYIESENKSVFTCPSCGYQTLCERGHNQICLICDWEDDNQDDETADEVWGGPNGVLSLTESRLVIGRRIQDKATTGARPAIDPEEALHVIENGVALVEDFMKQNIKSDSNIDDPVWQIYRDKRESILNNLLR